MSDEAGLENIPNIGPARRAALVAANVTTRAALARASVEQLVSMTGMPRILAEKTLATLASAPPPDAPPPAEEVPPTPPVVTPDDPIATPVLSDADHALATARTALADATRTPVPPRLLKAFALLAILFERLGAQTEQLLPKQQKRVTVLLQGLNARLEKIPQKPITSKREKRLCDRLRDDRRALLEAASLSTKRPKPTKD